MGIVFLEAAALSGERRPCITLLMGTGMGVALILMVLSKDQNQRVSASKSWYACG